MPHADYDARPSIPDAPLRPLVLIADREMLYRWFASESLEAVGLRVVSFPTVSDLVAYLDRVHDEVMILLDEQTLQNEQVDPDDVLRHAPLVVRILVLADAPEEVRLGPFAYAVVPKPADRDELVALVT